MLVPTRFHPAALNLQDAPAPGLHVGDPMFAFLAAKKDGVALLQVHGHGVGVVGAVASADDHRAAGKVALRRREQHHHVKVRRWILAMPRALLPFGVSHAAHVRHRHGVDLRRVEREVAAKGILEFHCAVDERREALPEHVQ